MMGKFNIFQLSRTQNYSRRQNVVKWIFILLVCAFAYRITLIYQLDAGAISLQERGNKQAYHRLNLKAQRGNIFDKNGEMLAGNLIFKKVNLDPTQIQTAFIPKLATALQMEKAQLQAKISKKLSKRAGRKNLIIAKNLRFNSPILANLAQLKNRKLENCTTKKPLNKADKTAAKICKMEKIKGVHLQTDNRRYYPKSAQLAPLIGRVNRDKIGTSGIEGEFNPTLAGQNGTQFLRFENKAYFNPATQKAHKNGDDISLTIDADIQHYAYSAIKKSVQKHAADSASAIVLNAKGEVLALANYPAENPNNRSVYNAKNYRNYVLSDNVDPGSTMKPFTMLLALNKGKIRATDDETIDVSKKIGHLKPDGKYYHMTIKKILQKSHNLGTAAVSERLSKNDFYQTWLKLGFGRPLGLISSIETSGMLRTPDSWSLAGKRSLSFGYGPMQTNLAQLAKAYLVFANDGAVLPLKLVKGVVENGAKTQVFSPQSTSKIASLLESVVSLKGSGYRARIKGYNVAGKTGTAEIVIDGKYNKKGAKRTFFAGFAPVKKPKYIMVVRLDYPKKCYAYYNPKIKISCEGSNSAAIVFKDAMQNILNSDPSIKLLAKK